MFANKCHVGQPHPAGLFSPSAMTSMWGDGALGESHLPHKKAKGLNSGGGKIQ
jgi:hypothetical protein